MNVVLLIAALLVVIGIVGSILPALPGPLFSYIGLLLLYFGKPNTISTPTIVVFGSLMVFLIVVDYLAPILGAKFSGAGKYGFTGALLGGLFGIIFFPPLGIFLGAFIGAVIGEMIQGKQTKEAITAGVGTLIGSVSVIILQAIYAIWCAVYFFVKLL